MVEKFVYADDFACMVRETQQKSHTPRVQKEGFTIA
jgi:hypothetical protein